MNASPASSLTVVGISGSLGADSATERLMRIALEGAHNEGAQTSLIDLRALDLPFCDGRDDYDTYPPAVQTLREGVRRAQGVIFASPEYHNSLSGALKNAFDLLTSGDLAGRMCGLLGVAGGGHGAINALNSMRLICRSLGAWVVPQQVSVSHVASAFDAGGRLRDAALERRIEHLGAVVASSARLHFPQHSISL